MRTTTLTEIQPTRLRIAASAAGDLVLHDAAEPIVRPRRELDTDERLRLAAIASERPALVVENQEGDYVVLIDQTLDLDRHLPLGPDDAELLSSQTVRAQFGRRDDDVLTLTPWADEDDVVAFDPDDARFADVPLVTVGDGGAISWSRGEAEAAIADVVADRITANEAEPGSVWGVLMNPFGEVECVPRGAAVAPHEDVRRHALLTTGGLLDGVNTLASAADRLRRLAQRFEAAEQQGWRLGGTVAEGLAYAERTDG